MNMKIVPLIALIVSVCGGGPEKPRKYNQIVDCNEAHTECWYDPSPSDQPVTR